MTPGKERHASLETLPNFDLAPGARLSAQFIFHGNRDFHAAARYVRQLPYARNSAWSLVLAERRGTCGTKHALLAALARTRQPVELRLGIYNLDGNTTHLTRDEPKEPDEDFLHEEPIEPEELGTYKEKTYRKFMREWALQRKLDFEQIWRSREEYIPALLEREST